MNQPDETIIQMFVATDQRDWGLVKDCFGEQVNLDYSSMNGNPAMKLTPDKIIESWQGILPGFESTHHQVGNILVENKGNKAQVFCYGTATHYLSKSINNEDGHVWTVVGSYDFELEKNADDKWKIVSMVFNFKYQDGNLMLPQRAIENVSE
ncbi:nuclear transport factor 2 family protein [Aureibacter tunicatorum]|uniref:SnoaL-like domain-containing protein n=1 Tax=Aureibacter tunicatorum TaxID=866807 RepID=A0AAE3XRK5_9BACT|nr:nuclear transport factor 2 family protein [Aureibacter tunicatorum]MDR6240758.1 hypothetical protein [Aureibacter tunicatorum]BDD06909.1 hypothetical protein AUTU_43920 [Aureibacter tunicatorum]